MELQKANTFIDRFIENSLKETEIFLSQLEQLDSQQKASLLVNVTKLRLNSSKTLEFDLMKHLAEISYTSDSEQLNSSESYLLSKLNKTDRRSSIQVDSVRVWTYTLRGLKFPELTIPARKIWRVLHQAIDHSLQQIENEFCYESKRFLSISDLRFDPMNM